MVDRASHLMTHIFWPVNLGVVLVLMGAQGVDAQPVAAADSQVPGVSVSFLRFVENGPPSVSTFRVTIMPTTNWTVFGPRSSGLGPTNITATNSITGGPAAVLLYTNASPYQTVIAVQSLEYATGSTWKQVPVPTEARVMVRVPPNSAVTQTIPVIATNLAWRVEVACKEQATGLSRAVERAKELSDQALTGQRIERFSGRVYRIKLSLPGAKAGPTNGLSP